MESLLPQLHAFYTTSLPPAQRAELQTHLLRTLQDPSLLPAAANYLASLPPPPSPPLDPYLLHYTLHAIEHTARSNFSGISLSQRAHLLSLLHKLLKRAYVPTGGIPLHAAHKAASAAAQLILREWLLDPNHPAVVALLALQDRDGASAREPAHILAATAVLAALPPAAADPMRRDLRAADRAVLKKRLREAAPSVLSALEVGARIAGPNVPRHVAVDAVRAIGGLVRVEPRVATEAVGVLMRCAGGTGGEISEEALGLLAEVIGEGKVGVGRMLAEAVEHAGALLEGVAMGEVGGGGEGFKERVVRYGDAVARRAIAAGGVGGLERLFNGLMGVVVRGGAEEVVEGLDAWISVLEAVEDAEASEVDLMAKVCTALTDICVKGCMHASNGAILRELDEAEGGLVAARSGSGGIFVWDEGAEMMAEVATDPQMLSSSLFVSADGMDLGGIGRDQNQDTLICSRETYVGKCVETMLACARLDPERIGAGVADFACAVMRTKGETVVHGPCTSAEDVEDLRTAVYTAYCVSAILPQGSPKTRAMFEVVCELVKAGAWRRDERFGISLLRTAAYLTRVLVGEPAEVVRDVGASLMSVAREVVVASNCPKMLASAAALLLVSLDSACRSVLFSSAPPIEPPIILATSQHAVAALGAAALTRWAIVPPRDPTTSLPIRWSEDEWRARQAALQALSSSIFDSFTKGCNLGDRVCTTDAIHAIARGAGLLKTVIMSVHQVHGATHDVMWHIVGAPMSGNCLTALRALHAQLAAPQAPLDDDAKHIVYGVLGCLVGTLGTVLRVCRRQAEAAASSLAADTIGLILDVARNTGSSRLGRAALQLIRDELSAGAAPLLAAGIDLAAQTLERGTGDTDVQVAAVGALVEALKRHWVQFWPGDVATATERGDVTAGQSPTRVADEGVKRLYFRALHGVLAGLRSADLGTCRSALLGLQGLEAARRLFRREEAFRRVGAAQAVVVECFRVLGGGGEGERESLGEEAVEVVWGVARVNLGWFYGEVVEGVVREIGGVDEREGRELVKGWGGVEERPGFVRAAASFVNDFVYLRVTRRGPSL